MDSVIIINSSIGGWLKICEMITSNKKIDSMII